MCKYFSKILCELRLMVIVSLSIIVLCCFSIVDVNAASDKDTKVGAPIKIGISGPMKFAAGKHVVAGAQIAAEEINAKGGIRVGDKLRKIELVVSDSNEYLSIPDAVNCLERLVTVDKVDFIIAGARSEATLAQMEVMADYKKIYLFPGGGIPQHTELVHRDYDRYKYFFRISAPNNYYQAKCHGAMLESVVATLKKELGIDRPKMAILGEKAAWADTYAKTAREMASILGVEIVGEWRPSATANDLTAELTAIKKSGAHIIFEAFSGPVGVIFGKQLGELKIPVSTLGLNIEGSQFKYWKSTNGMCEYETTLNSIVRANITKKTIPFFDKFVQKTGEYPLYSATGGYDGVYLFKEASERAGTLKSDKVVNELEKVKYAGAAGTIAFYPKSHKWTHDLVFGPGYSTTYGTQWIDGKLITVWPDGKRIDPKLEMGDGWEKFKIRGISKLKLSPYMIKYWKNK